MQQPILIHAGSLMTQEERGAEEVTQSKEVNEISPEVSCHD